MARPKKAADDVLDSELAVDGDETETEEGTAAPTAAAPTPTVATDEDTVQILMRRTLPNLLIGPKNYGPLEARKTYKLPLHVAEHLRSIDAA